MTGPDSGAEPSGDLMAGRCRATAKSTGKRCTQPGDPVCRFHGGAAPQVKAKAAERHAEAQLVAAAQELAPAEPITDALAALAQLAGEVVRFKDLAASRLDALGDEIRYTAAGAGTEQLRAEFAVLERAFDRCDRVLGRIAGLDIDNRLARISEQQAHTVARILVTALTAAGVTGTPLQEAKTVLARELRVAS